jgi:hypothetical protein
LARSVSSPPKRFERSFLKHAQQLGLGREAHVGDLVEEDRAAVALLELAAPALGGTRESTALVAEELALEQRLGNRRAVDRQEGSVAARAVLVHGARHELLARAALADQQDVGIAGCDAADELADLLHGGAVADDAIGAAVAAGVFLEPHFGAHEP